LGFRKEGVCRSKRIDSVELKNLLLHLLRFPRLKMFLLLVSLFQGGRLPRNLPSLLQRRLFVRHLLSKLLSKLKEMGGVRGDAQAEREEARSRSARSRSALGIRPTRSIFGASNGPSKAFNAY
jgi:hypothetical protein